jgi:hypothetical protein
MVPASETPKHCRERLHAKIIRDGAALRPPSGHCVLVAMVMDRSDLE